MKQCAGLQDWQTHHKMSAAHRRRGTWSLTAGEPWSADDDAKVRSLKPKDAVAATGRTLGAVYQRRRKLPLSLGRTTDERFEHDPNDNPDQRPSDRSAKQCTRCTAGIPPGPLPNGVEAGKHAEYGADRRRDPPPRSRD